MWPRRVRDVLGKKSSNGSIREKGRRGGNYRGPIDRRTGNAADDADIPHWWNCKPDVQTADYQGEERRRSALQRFANRASARWQLDCVDQEWLDQRAQRGRPRTRTLQRRDRFNDFEGRRSAREKRRDVRAMGSV